MRNIGQRRHSIARVVVSACFAIAGSGLSTGSAYAEPPAYRPCEWVGVEEVGILLGGLPATTVPRGDDPGSVNFSCSSTLGSGRNGVTSELRLPGAFPVDAATELALAASAGNGSDLQGIGRRAVCVTEPSTTPPSTTVLVLLSGDRLFRATGWYSLTCDSLKRFADIAIRRIGS